MRHRRTFALTTIGLALAGLTLTACSSGEDHSSMEGMESSMDHSMMDMGSSSATPSSSPSSGGTEPATAGSEAEIVFAQSMIPHHQQAVQMADMALETSSNPAVIALAKEIKKAQDPEIALMKEWLTAWGAEVPMDMDMEGMDHSGMDMGGMEGMMSDEDMSMLSMSTGAEFDRMWLEMMIVHHEGAVVMAEDVLATSPSPDVQKLADAIIEAQTKEIAEMRELLK